ncbi:MAG: DEAD/DEAH box helicase [Candidatus Nomurabacteria bacterium]|nr:MAG: DEAD/DEAH box helicase [Candidatus Nomurabacteria bacterium]
MDSAPLTLQTKTLQRSSDLNNYRLYRAALEWELIDPIVIEDRDDMHSESSWRDRLEPYHHQVTNLITFCRRLPVTLLADDVGLGKTISAGLVLSELISRGRISKILIVCPKILRDQWKEELEIKFRIPSTIVTGRELITAKPPEEPGAVITTYNTARLYLDRIDQNGFEILILDEAHKLRNLYGVDPTPQVAIKFRKALADRMFKYVLMLTATPIQNRLWDLYSLVDLLTVARGHENPFGTPGIFARKFIADSRTQARQLNPEMRDEFRSIIYGYMSRVRRGDAKLHFPERVVQLHKVDPTPEELQLIGVVGKSIQQLNALTQIVILQALVSSPEALIKMLEGMAKKGTVPREVLANVKESAKEIQITTKLKGLGALVEKLRKEQPNTWRVVVFTRWRETQTTIETFLEKQGVKCGLINGDSSKRNQETIQRFKKDLPDINVIISTEAGSEGVNLQAANVLVNYDLPWNPMIVEQRIGRIQRLASNYANVSIFNIVLQNTFEEYIVGRLMEKLQMASHAIGDIEALLEASGIDEGEENGSSGFEEKIRQLVVASLAGKDVEQATRKAEQSISEAKTELDHEEKNINALLGGMSDSLDSGPRCPKLPQTTKSMDVRDFTTAALMSLGAELHPKKDGLLVSQLAGKKELIRFDNNTLSSEEESVLYAPGTSTFERLVHKVANVGKHIVEDLDKNPQQQIEKVSRQWVESFGGDFENVTVEDVSRCFAGVAIIRARSTVAHDSYERLIEVSCAPTEHFSFVTRTGLEPIGDYIENPTSVGALSEKLIEKASQDSSILEFCRFYLERRSQEIASAGNDERKKKKLEDEFTPRLEFSLVGLEGKVHRIVKNQVSYRIEREGQYKSTLMITPSSGQVDMPGMGQCMKTGKTVPSDCLAKCEISGLIVLRHFLDQSEISNRLALPEHIVLCTLSNKRVLADEAIKSDVTGKLVAKKFLKTSSLSGKFAEPQFINTCEFTKTEVLESEIAVSQISGKRYRIDEQLKSAVSGKLGHRQEFVASSISSAPLLEEEAIRSVTGKFCAPMEARPCTWSGRKCHPEDLRTCELTGVQIHSEYVTLEPPIRLETLNNLLNGTRSKSDKLEVWPSLSNSVTALLKAKRCKIETAEVSPSDDILAASIELRTFLGLRVSHIGVLYSIKDGSVVGRVARGKRGDKGWNQTKN